MIGTILRLFFLIVPVPSAFNDDNLDKMLEEINKAAGGIHQHETVDSIKASAECSLASYLVDIFQVCLQAVILLVIKHDQFNINSVEGRLGPMFVFLLQCIAMSNFMAWVSGSFIAFESVSETPWLDFFYTKKIWTVLAQFTLPVTLFFRFHSVHVIIEMFIEPA